MIILNHSPQHLEYQPDVDGFEYVEGVKGRDNGNLPLLIAFHYSAGKPTETISDYDSLKNPIRIIVSKGNYNKRNGFHINLLTIIKKIV